MRLAPRRLAPSRPATPGPTRGAPARLVPAVVAAASCLAAIALPRPAAACSCLAPGETFFFAPEDGATNVPTNAVVWVGAAITRGNVANDAKRPIELFDAGGVAVPGSEGRLVGGFDTIDAFTPAVDLAPDATYTVVVGDETLVTFTTGAGPDTEAPEPPTEIARSGWSRPAGPANPSSCSTGRASHGVSFDVDLGDDGVVLLLDADGRAAVDADARSGTVPAVSPFGSALLGAGLACGGDNWPDAGFRASAEVRFASFDRAGNFSGWSEATTAVASKDGRGGCDAAGGRRPGLLGLALGALLLGGVRRRSSRLGA